MDFSRPAKRDEDAFLNHSLKFIGKKGKNPELEKAIAEGRDAYDFVGSGKPMKPKRQKKDYKNIQSTYMDEKPEAEKRRVVNTDNSLNAAYYYLNEYGGVRFGNQQEDGTWEVYPIEPEVKAQETYKPKPEIVGLSNPNAVDDNVSENDPTELNSANTSDTLESKSEEVKRASYKPNRSTFILNPEVQEMLSKSFRASKG